ncbi:MAG TPA: hypothetical protein VJK02_21090 [Anaerolineales bacterium]|nr:hypothetical protein [Anaerolineales bacterium]
MSDDAETPWSVPWSWRSRSFDLSPAEDPASQMRQAEIDLLREIADNIDRQSLDPFGRLTLEVIVDGWDIQVVAKASALVE